MKTHVTKPTMTVSWTSSSPLPGRGRRAIGEGNRDSWPSLRLLAGQVMLAVTLLLLQTAPTQGQSSWEYSPYGVHFWIQVAPTCSVTPARYEAMLREVAERADVAMGPAWNLTVSAPPAALVTSFTEDLDLVSAKTIEAVDPTSLEQDKVFLGTVSGSHGDYRISVREIDCRTRSAGPLIQRRTRQSKQLPSELLRAVTQAFAAVVRIEAGEGRSLTVRVRAGGLIRNRTSSAYVGRGDVFVPIIRRNDRVGKPARISVVDFTYLQVEGPNETTPNLLDVYVHSAWRSPIRGRGGTHREQYGLRVRRATDSTELRLDSQVSRDQAAYPLEGLEIYAKPAVIGDGGGEAGQGSTSFLGHTDWRGSVRVEQGESPLMLVYVKSGGRLLARLPVVPGDRAMLRVELPDDDPRLHAEGTIHGFNSELMDLIAQRRILSAAIRKRLEEGRAEEANRLMQRFNQLPSRTDMQTRLAQYRRRQPASRNRTVQSQIEKLFTEARTALKFIDSGLQTRLMNELRQGGVAGEGS